MISNYTDKCGSCARYTFYVMKGEIRMIGKCYTDKKGERINLASCKKCEEYIKREKGEKWQIQTPEGRG